MKARVIFELLPTYTHHHQILYKRSAYRTTLYVCTRLCLPTSVHSSSDTENLQQTRYSSCPLVLGAMHALRFIGFDKNKPKFHVVFFSIVSFDIMLMILHRAIYHVVRTWCSIRPKIYLVQWDYYVWAMWTLEKLYIYHYYYYRLPWSHHVIIFNSSQVHSFNMVHDHGWFSR